jgi:pantetheine-phosphate adenylyltransferase
MKALICGSFDPITNGHLDLIKRAVAIFGDVTVGVFINPDKTYLFSADERANMIREATRDINGVSVITNTGYVVDYCTENGISVIVKGIRNTDDYEYEMNMAIFNKNRAPHIETVFLPAYESMADISSSQIRKMYQENKDFSAYVPKCVKDAFDTLK